MAKNSIRDYSATNSSNTDIQSIDISEGCSPAGINNAIREVMADLKDVSTGAVALESPAMDSLTVDTTGIVYSGGNVGIGTSSPNSYAGYTALTLNHATNGGIIDIERNGTLVGEMFTTDANTFSLAAVGAKAINFNTNSTERLRIDSSGNVGIGTSSPIVSSAEKLTILGGSSSPYDACLTMKSGYATGSTYVNGVYFLDNASNTAGYIAWNGSSTSYSTSSDYRLKTAVNYDWDATTRLKQLRPARFEWIADGDDAVPVDGFLAHEVQDVVPEAITGTKDAMRDEEYEVTPAVLDEDGNEITPAVMGTRSVPDYQGIDQSKLTPLLTKALIEAVEKIEQLEARITALEAN